MIPGLEKAEFVRFGVMHRNTFLESPKLLTPTLQFLKRKNLLQLVKLQEQKVMQQQLLEVC